MHTPIHNLAALIFALALLPWVSQAQEVTAPATGGVTAAPVEDLTPAPAEALSPAPDESLTLAPAESALTNDALGDYQGNPYYSGGIGVTDREDLAKLLGEQYNLKLEFALTSGEYIANVDVRILDAQGATVMEATSTGPWFLTRLEPGTYKVVTSGFGREFQQTVTVPAKGSAELVFNGWESA